MWISSYCMWKNAELLFGLFLGFTLFLWWKIRNKIRNKTLCVYKLYRLYIDFILLLPFRNKLSLLKYRCSLLSVTSEGHSRGKSPVTSEQFNQCYGGVMCFPSTSVKHLKLSKYFFMSMARSSSLQRLELCCNAVFQISKALFYIKTCIIAVVV